MAKTIADTGGANTTVPGEKKKVESKYSAFEFAKAASTNTELFGADVTQDIVTAAFFVAGKQEATKAEAKEIVKSFLKGGRK